MQQNKIFAVKKRVYLTVSPNAFIGLASGGNPVKTFRVNFLNVSKARVFHN